MQRFAPPAIPFDAPDWFRDYAQRLHENIKSAAAGGNDFALKKVLHAEPSRIVAGMEIYADGTDFNPGSGEGLYRRNAANTAWVFLG